MKSLVAALAAFLMCVSVLAEDTVFIQVLGIAQDAGYPQTNCYQPHCMRGWENPELRRMTSSIAVINPTEKSTLPFHAAPDMRE